MSYMQVGDKDNDTTDSRSRQIDESQAVLNSAALLTGTRNLRVSNVCGSTAGAGSGTFHKYRQAKRREQFRWQAIQREGKINDLNANLKKRKLENEEQLDRSKKRRKKNRQRKKLRKKINKQSQKLNMNQTTNTNHNETEETQNISDDNINNNINSNDSNNINEINGITETNEINNESNESKIDKSEKIGENSKKGKE